jgi:hypothetical protein
MGVFARVAHSLAEAFWTNWHFLTHGSDELPAARNLLAAELRTLIERDLPILIHKRSRAVADDGDAQQRWSNDLHHFVSGSLRPRLAGNSLLALWNDGALQRMLETIVASEQNLVAVRTTRLLPVTSRFDSPWAG